MGGSFIYFLLVVAVAFLIPGLVFLHKIKLTTAQKIILSLVVGMTFWGWQGFIFGFLNIRWMSYIYIIIFVIAFLTLNRGKLKFSSLVVFPKFDRLLLLIIVIGVVLQTSVVWQMGIRVNDRLYFCCGAIGDFMYHLRLTNEIIHKIPPFEPDMFGEHVRNYHYLGNIVVAEMVRVFNLPFVFTQFQFMGIFLSSMFGLSALVFAQINNWTKPAIRWLLFLLYFSGDFIYILILFLGRPFDLSMGPLENGMALLNNPPRSFAMVGFFAGISLLSYWVKRKNLITGIVMSFVLSSLISFKVYVGIFALCGVVALGIYYFLKKEFKMLFPLMICVILSLVIYLPVNIASGGLRFMGFWRFEEFIVQPALGLSHLELARQVFLSHQNWIRVFLYDILFMLLFIFSIFGPKLIGLFQTAKSLSLLKLELHIFLAPSLLISFIIGLFFWQTSGGSNSFNFLVTVYIISSIYAAIAYSYWFGKMKKPISIALVVGAVLLNFPRIAYEEWKNLNVIAKKEGISIHNADLEAMKYVKEKTNSESLFIYHNAPYLTFLAQRPVFLGDWGLLESHEIRTATRRQTVKTITEFDKPEEAYDLLKKHKITHLYLSSGEESVSTRSSKLLKTVYKNSAVKILKVM